MTLDGGSLSSGRGGSLWAGRGGSHYYGKGGSLYAVFANSLITLKIVYFSDSLIHQLDGFNK